MLIVLAGLPGTGKSTVASTIARELAATVVAVDDIEAAMLVAGVDQDQPTGLAAYVVAERLARLQLAADRAVVIDAVNDAPEARAQWAALATSMRAPIRWIELRVADRAEHRRRLEARVRDLPGAFPEPSWSSIEARRASLERWDGHRLVLDAGGAPDAVGAEAMRSLRAED